MLCLAVARCQLVPQLGLITRTVLKWCQFWQATSLSRQQAAPVAFLAVAPNKNAYTVAQAEVQCCRCQAGVTTLLSFEPNIRLVIFVQWQPSSALQSSVCKT